jgi:hypothetical protein
MCPAPAVGDSATLRRTNAGVVVAVTASRAVWHLVSVLLLAMPCILVSGTTFTAGHAPVWVLDVEYPP